MPEGEKEWSHLLKLFFLLLMGGASGNGHKTTQERKATPIKTFHTTVAFKRIVANIFIAAKDSVKSENLSNCCKPRIEKVVMYLIYILKGTFSPPKEAFESTQVTSKLVKSLLVLFIPTQQCVARKVVIFLIPGNTWYLASWHIFQKNLPLD